LHHVNLRVSATELQLLREFYCDALGLSVGWRPPFKSNGLWLYAGDIPIVHLVEATGTVPAIEHGAASRFDHIALRCSDLEPTLERLEAKSISYRVVPIPASAEVQVVLSDPLGFTVELNFAP
jgi:catechol 2,3-dioxygenase-like lactoylglutathione lyase family enzyme